MTKDLHTFSSVDGLASELATRIAGNLRSAVDNFGVARILLSGGSTPWPVYAQLSQLELPWRSVELGLVDERFVPATSEYSNERNIRGSILQGSGSSASFFSMVQHTNNASENLTQIRRDYERFSQRTDVVILGMGTDGHTASLFPGDAASEALLETSETGVFTTNAPNVPKERITCSSALLLQATHIYLLISGQEKWDVLQLGDSSLPIHRFLNARNDIHIYYALS